MTPPDQVGLILVHGIGEQRRFEHLDQQLRPLIRTLRRQHKGDVTVEIRSAEAAANLAEQDTWRGGPDASARIIVRHDGGETHLMVHEVWWADVNEPYSLMKRVRFWAWGLSIWNFPAKYKSRLKLAEQRMAVVAPTGQDRREARFKIFLAGVICSWLALAYTPSFGLLQRVVKFRTPRFIQTLVNYLSTIKLYNQKVREGANLGTPADFLDAFDAPPRVSVRRRMIRTLSDVACGPYQRWYILAHSLGSVVAFNGLMEPGYVFPHYLDQPRWDKLVERGLGGPASLKDFEAPLETMPERPAWLKPHDFAYRPKIFEKFRGIMTYGSPLGKFSAIWPALIPFCREPAFDRTSVWINAFDPLDPVSGPSTALDFIEEPPHPQLSCCPPKSNVGYASSPILLLGHIDYLKPNKDGRDLAGAVAKWLLHDSPNAVTEADEPGFFKNGDRRFNRRTSLFNLQLALVCVVLLLATEGVYTASLRVLFPKRFAGNLGAAALWSTLALAAPPVGALTLGLASRALRKRRRSDRQFDTQGVNKAARGPGPVVIKPVAPVGA